MYYLCHQHREADLYREVIPEIRHFFAKVRQIKQTLGNPQSDPYLNRIQRERCKNNLFTFEKLAHEFDRIENRDDYLLLHRQLQRYLKLHTSDLKRVLGRESSKPMTLFMYCG